MKKVLFVLLGIILLQTAKAQNDPVSWTFSSKKISATVYELRMTATIKSGWHIYAQTQPKNAIAFPTAFAFTSNPLLTIDGKVQEVGKMEKAKDPTLRSTAHQYSNTVDFVQKVTLKSSVKTALSGTVEYQTCDHTKCLPPKKVPFKVSLG